MEKRYDLYITYPYRDEECYCENLTRNQLLEEIDTITNSGYDISHRITEIRIEVHK